MKYVSFENNNKKCFGILEEENIYDLTAHYEKYREGLEWLPTLKSALEQDKLGTLADLNLSELTKVTRNEVSRDTCNNNFSLFFVKN